MATLREERLCEVAGQRLMAAGWRVSSEVPHQSRRIDLVATRDDELLVLEAKSTFSQQLQRQILSVAWLSDIALTVVATTPRGDKLAWARRCNIGVWHVTPEGTVEVLVEHVGRHPTRSAARQRIVSRAHRMQPGVRAGRPCLSGEGPAIDVHLRILAYRADHPDATWREMFTRVPNHYASARSLAGAMTGAFARLAGRGMALPRVPGGADELPHTCPDGNHAAATPQKEIPR